MFNLSKITQSPKAKGSKEFQEAHQEKSKTKGKTCRRIAAKGNIVQTSIHSNRTLSHKQLNL